MKKFFYIIMIFLFSILMTVCTYAADFSDVPKSHWAYENIKAIRELGITDGIGGNKFGLGQEITRAQFLAFLSNLLNWDLSKTGSSFTDNQNPNEWYYKYIEAAVENGTVLKDTATFRPNEPITREEIAVMLIRALGYEPTFNIPSPFTDVSGNSGYITMAYDFGIISGIGDGKFAPNNKATREQAAAMVMRTHSALNDTGLFMNGFYAISSYSQKDYMKDLDSVCFGWGRFDLKDGDIILNTSSSNNNEYSIPSGYKEPVELARSAGNKILLMLTVQDIKADNGKELVEYIISENRLPSIEMIKQVIGNPISFDGVVVDFENLRGVVNKENLNMFLMELRKAIGNKLIYVAVHPVVRPGEPYYDAYDYKTIGSVADKIILMAHDYYAKNLTEEQMQQNSIVTPLAPIFDVYYAIKSIPDEIRGKVLLQISFDTVQWKQKGGKIINRQPYHPKYDAVVERIRTVSEKLYSRKYQSPYILFTNTEDGTENTLWYEDSRSVTAKINLAKLFKLNGISFWRLGNIPNYNNAEYLNIWDSVNGN